MELFSGPRLNLNSYLPKAPPLEIYLDERGKDNDHTGNIEAITTR